VTESIGIVWLGGNWYDPIEGHFLSPDSMGHDANTSLYDFCLGNPLGRWDADGRFSKAMYQNVEGSVVGTGEAVWNLGGGIAQGATSIFGSDTSDIYGSQTEGLKNAAGGLGVLAAELFMSFAGSEDATEALGTTLTGGENKSGAYRAGFAVASVGTMLAGGELGEAGEVGNLGKVGEVSDIAADVSSVTENVTTPIGELRAAGLKDAHHVIQDAAVRDLPGYDTQLAPGVQLEGPSTEVGTPHYSATQAQRAAGGGTYAAEREIAASSLRAAGYSEAQIQQALSETDNYFQGIGVNSSTTTRIPGNRKP
jgi:hypothetical protein